MTTWNWQILRAGPLLLDGGGMFGVIPKPVWSRSIDCDEKNRVEVAHNCVLLESSETDTTLGRPRRVLIETGTGDKMDPKMSAIFGLEPDKSIDRLVEAVGVDPAEIDHVVVTHLHFDHAGGLTRRCRAGETPDWTAQGKQASGDEPNVKLTFPNATVFVQDREWRDAIANDAVMTRTYYRDHLLPLEAPLPDGSPRVRHVRSASPFTPGRVPHRDELPDHSVDERWDEVLPGLRVFLTPGHTWGQQAVAFDASDGGTVVFVPDLMPTVHHVGAAYSLGYDVEPYTAMITKRWFLAEAAARGWTLVLDHEPGHPIQRAWATEKGWFELKPIQTAT
ncbi:MAG: MBL fold metallo-hydrolase [Phycisphaerales bacterium]